MLLVADDRLLAEVIVAAGGHRLVPALVDAWPVPRVVGVVPCLAFGRVQALVLAAPVAGFRAVTVPVFPSVRPVHLRSPFHCADGMPARRAARELLAMAVSTTSGFAALTFRRPVTTGRLVLGNPRPQRRRRMLGPTGSLRRRRMPGSADPRPRQRHLGTSPFAVPGPLPDSVCFPQQGQKKRAN